MSDEFSGGVRQGMGQSFGCCLGMVMIPTFILLGIGTCTKEAVAPSKRAAHDEEAQKALAIAELKDERRQRLQKAGVNDVPDVYPASVQEMRKQMRIEGVSPDSGFFDKHGDRDAMRQASQPLKDAADIVMRGKVAGEVEMVEELAGVQIGDPIVDVMQRFDAATSRGETNSIVALGNAWPDMMFYSYERANVMFLVRGGLVELIVVGMTDRGLR